MGVGLQILRRRSPRFVRPVRERAFAWTICAAASIQHKRHDDTVTVAGLHQTDAHFHRNAAKGGRACREYRGTAKSAWIRISRVGIDQEYLDRKSTRLNSSHVASS